MTLKPEYLAPCGLYCGVCAILIAHQGGNEKFKERLVKLYQGHIAGKGTLPGAEKLTTADIRCGGCLSDDRFMHCQQCAIRDCAQAKGIAGCQDCADFPCGHIDNFPMTVGQRVILRCIPHIKEVGHDQWAQEEEARYFCPQCGQKLFRGVVKCNKCGVGVDLD